MTTSKYIQEFDEIVQEDRWDEDEHKGFDSKKGAQLL